MNKDKALGTIANIGELIVLIGAICWIAYPNTSKYIFSVGTFVMIVGRLQYASKAFGPGRIALRRLYGQCIGALFMLAIAALLMWFYKSTDGYEIGNYVLRTPASAWLMPFMIFVVIELYTAFRIPAELKKEEQ